MKIIAHRGNINGPCLDENSPEQIEKAIEFGFDVEVDLWVINNKLMLGHDEPTYDINEKWILTHCKTAWFHCKNLESAKQCLNFLDDGIKFFWHQEDDFTLTSNGYFWTYPGKSLCFNSIAVMPETTGDIPKDIYAICTDYPIKYNILI
jgi:hypothetical protein